MLVVIHQANLEAQRRDECIDRAVAAPREHLRRMVARHVDFELHVMRAVFGHAVRDVVIRLLLVQVLAREQRVQVGRIDFAAALVGLALHDARELDLQAARQLQAVFLLEQVRHAAFARLAVDADDRIVAAPQVGRIDRQVRHFPDGVGLLLRKPLLDRILVRTRERREHQIARIRMARVHRQLVAILNQLAHGVDVRKVQARVHALRVQVHRQRDQIDVTSALAVTKQAALDAIRTGHHGQFGSGDGGAAVVVRVDADDERFAVVQVAAHPFDLVGIDIRRGRFDGRRQVDDHFVGRRRLPDGADRIGDLLREIQLGRRERFRRILQAPLGLRMLGRQILDQLRALDGDLHDLVALHIEHHAAEHRRDRVVDVDDRALGANGRFDGAANQLIARLGQHDDGDVVRDVLVVDQHAHEIEVGLRGGREAHLDLLDADLDQHFEEAQLLLRAHRLDQCLVTVAQVGAHPDRRRGDGAAWPLAVCQVDGREGTVLGGGIGQHDRVLLIGLVTGRRGCACGWRRLPGGPRIARPGNRSVGLALRMGRKRSPPGWTR